MKNFVTLSAAAAGAIALILLALFWVGMPLVNLALFDERRDQPYLLLEFARGAPAEVLQARYAAPLARLVASEGGVQIGRYRLSHLLDGTRDDEWPHFSQFHMARAQDVAQVVTSSPYRAFAAFTDGVTQVRIGGYAEKPPNWRGAFAIWLVEDLQNSEQDPLDNMRKLVQAGKGQVVWDRSIEALSVSQAWQRMFVVAFENEKAANAWLSQSEVSTARKIARAQARRMSLALYIREA